MSGVITISFTIDIADRDRAEVYMRSKGVDISLRQYLRQVVLSWSGKHPAPVTSRLTRKEALTLTSLAENGPETASQIAARINSSPSNQATMMKHLEVKGLVLTVWAQRRIFKLTEAGLAALETTRAAEVQMQADENARLDLITKTHEQNPQLGHIQLRPGETYAEKLTNLVKALLLREDSIPAEKRVSLFTDYLAVMHENFVVEDTDKVYIDELQRIEANTSYFHARLAALKAECAALNSTPV